MLFSQIKKTEYTSLTTKSTCPTISTMYVCPRSSKAHIGAYTNVMKKPMPRFENLEKLSLKLSSSLFVICVDLLHPRFLMVYCDVFGIFLSKLVFSGFLQFKGNFVGSQNNRKYPD